MTVNMENGLTKDKAKEAQWTRTLIVTAVASSLGTAVPGGYCLGIINSPAVHIRAWCKEMILQSYGVQLSHTALDLFWSSVVSIYLVGAMLGALNGAWLSNRLGRRGVCLLSGFLFVLGGICFFCCRMLNSVEILLIGRIIVGLAAGLTTTCLPMYHNEIAAINQRGTLSVSCAIGFTAGVLLAQLCTLQSVFGNAEQWHYALSFYVVIVVICFMPYTFYPESPKWLYIVRNRRSSTNLTLARLRGNVCAFVIDEEVAAMSKEANQSKNESIGYRKLLTDPRLMLPLVLLCSSLVGQQLSGINTIFFYSGSIFRKAGFSSQVCEWMNLCTGCINLAISLLGPLLMATFNRRTLMLTSSLCCSVFLLAIGFLLHYINLVPWFAYACIASIFLFIIGFQIALGSMPSFIGAELFEVSPRSAAMSLGNVMAWSGNFLVAMTFQMLLKELGSWVFLIYSVNCALLFCLTKKYLPETKGRPTHEIAELVSHGFNSKVI